MTKPIQEEEVVNVPIEAYEKLYADSVLRRLPTLEYFKEIAKHFIVINSGGGYNAIVPLDGISFIQEGKLHSKIKVSNVLFHLESADIK